MSELKPCAHCGHPMGIARRNRYGNITYVLSCTNPECHLNAPQNRSTFRVREEAVIANNTRYERTCHNKSVEGERLLLCSKCGAFTKVTNATEYIVVHYCGNCGAKVVDE